MIIKVCGLREPENIAAIRELDIDWMGMIYYPNSPRYVGGSLDAVSFNGKERVGVFVNESLANIKQAIFRFGLTMIQLHGDEEISFCKQVRRLRIKVIKAIAIREKQDFDIINDYEDNVDYILLDTKSEVKGGSGKKFDWSLLSNYTADIPFLVSGGIGPDDVDNLKEINHSWFAGVDLNSRFEEAPGLKKVELVKEFVQEMRGVGNEV